VGDRRACIHRPAPPLPHGRRRAGQAGITQGTIRLSIGLEDPDDLIDDLKRAEGGGENRRGAPQLDVNGHSTYCYTGGKAFNAAQPTVVFIHGAQRPQRILQTCYLAHHGWNVPRGPAGHGKAAETRLSVEAAADFITACSTRPGSRRPRWSATAGAPDCAAGRQRAIRISHLAMVGTAFPMKVSPALLMSLNRLRLTWSTSFPTRCWHRRPRHGAGHLVVWHGPAR
jgi:hypothetical protein